MDLLHNIKKENIKISEATLEIILATNSWDTHNVFIFLSENAALTNTTVLIYLFITLRFQKTYI